MKHQVHASLHTESVDERVASIAARSHGVFSHEQAVAVGAGRGFIAHRLAVRRWERLHLGVYRLNGVPTSWHQSLLAACLAAGNGAVASHRSAGALWELVGMLRGLVELSIPAIRHVRRVGLLVHRVEHLGSADVTTVEAIPVTTPTRTLIDLAGVVTRDVLEEALDDALRRRLTTIARLRWRISKLGRRGRPGIGALLRFLDERSGTAVPQSILETRVARFIRGAGLPSPIRQFPVRHGGRSIAIVDFAYPDLKLAIEADGHRWHSSRTQWEHDRGRRNELTEARWRVIHVTARDLEQRPDETLRRLRRAYFGSAQAIGP